MPLMIEVAPSSAPDEIDAEQANEGGENQPGKQFARWDCSGSGGGGENVVEAVMSNSLGISRPRLRRASSQEESDSRPNAGRSQWRDRAGFPPASTCDAHLLRIRSLAALSIEGAVARNLGRGSRAASRGVMRS